MRNRRFLMVFLFSFGILFTVFSQLQQLPVEALSDMAGRQLRISTESGASFQGILYSVTDDFVLIQDRDGQILTLLRAVIEEVELIPSGPDKKAYYQDSAANRLLVMPTGFPMEPGEFHIADQEIAAVTMSYGVSENFSLWGGISIPGALVSARYTWPLGDKAAFSAGTFAGISWIEFVGLMIPYTIFSVGTPEDNFTVGTGAVVTFHTNEFALDAAVLALGKKWVLSDTTAIVTETWILWGKRSVYYTDREENVMEGWDAVPLAAVPGIAFRIAGEKFSWDVGAVLPILVTKDDGEYTVEGLGGEYTFIPIPLISLTYRID